MRDIEHLLQVAFFDYIKFKHKDLWKSASIFAIPMGGARSAITGARLKSEGCIRGVPDIFCCKPCGGFNGLWIELKSGKNKLTPEQDHFIQERLAQNYSCAVCYSLDSAIAVIERYLTS